MGYISIKNVLDDLLAHPKLKHLTLERAVNYAVHFLKIVGMPKTFSQKTAKLDIVEHRALLPCDYYQMRGVREVLPDGKPGKAYRYATNTFCDDGNRDLTYKVQGTIIYTSVKEGKLEIAYDSILVDEDGYPLIPDDSAFIRALELYIKVQVFTILMERGKLKLHILTNAQQEYAWAVAQAQSSLLRPSLDEMESISNHLNSLVLHDDDHDKSFSRLGEKEKLRW